MLHKQEDNSAESLSEDMPDMLTIRKVPKKTLSKPRTG